MPLNTAHLDSGRSWRGGQAQALHLIRGLMGRGARCTLLAPPGRLLDGARAAGATTLAWRARADWDLGAVVAAVRALRALRPDVVHAHDARAHLAAVASGRAAGAAVVVARRVTRPVGANPFSRWKYALPVDRYLCVSGAVREAMVRSGVAPERLAIVRSGVELRATLERADLRALVGAPADAPVVVTIAALTREKGGEVWLEAATKLSALGVDVHWVWIGDGPERGALARRAAALGLASRVRYLGFRDDARALLASATVFVLPSRDEGLGTSILDAQALGIPVVASAVGGIPEIVEQDVNGWLVEAGNPASLADAVHRTLADPERRRRWRDAAWQSVACLGLDSMVEQTLAQYREVLTTRRATGVSEESV